MTQAGVQDGHAPTPGASSAGYACLSYAASSALPRYLIEALPAALW